MLDKDKKQIGGDDIHEGTINYLRRKQNRVFAPAHIICATCASVGKDDTII